MMKFKKIIFLMIIFIFALIISVNANTTTNTESENIQALETVEIDVTTIAENFNNNIYVSNLSNLGITVMAEQVEGLITLMYNDTSSVDYYIDSSTNVLSTTYEMGNTECDVLNALFIETISTMQGNESGLILPFAWGDHFCYSSLTDNGIGKNYLYEDGKTVISFEINPSIKLTLPETSTPLTSDDFLVEYETFYPDENCLVRDKNLIFYKTFLEDGTMELYIGQMNELTTEQAYQSILNAVDILFEDTKAAYYFKQNYSDFSLGNFEFDGVSVNVDITSLPTSTIETVLTGANMKYAKFTINRDIVKEKLPSVVIDNPEIGDTSKNSNNKLSLGIIILVFIFAIVIIGFVIRFHKNSKK